VTLGDRKVSRKLGPGVRSILRNGAYLLGSNWLAAALRAAYVVILARALGPAGYGLISSTQALYIMLLLVGTAGLPAFLSRELAADRARGEEAVGLTLLVLAASLSLGAGAFILLGLTTESDPVARQVFFLFAGALVARGLAMWARHAFVAHEASHYHMRQVSIFRTGEVLVAAGALAMGAAVVAIAAIHLASWILEAAAGLALVHRRLAALRLRPPDWPRLRTVARGALAISGALAAGDWLRVAPLALYRYVAEAAPDVGQFALAWNAALILAMMPVAVMTAASPVISRARVRADGKDAYYLDFCIRGGVILGTAAVIGGMAFGPWAITLAAGEEYARAGAIFPATLSILGPIVMNYALDQTLFLHGRTGLVFLLNAGALLAVAAVFVPASQAFGPAAAVLAVFTTLAALVLVKIVTVRAVAGIVLLPSLLRAGVAAGAALAAAVPLTALLPWAGVAGGLATLVLAAFVSKAVAPHERRTLLALVRRQHPS